MHSLEKMKTGGLTIKIPREVWAAVVLLAATVVALAIIVATRN